ncbi:Taurine transport ATP-binding protein TauB [Euzebya pacifica]|uniref:Taurine transport ATP-binding protein TauB n=1 Tax=Euzebya pacifica TaxID=1608957 RepID=A0A346XWR5_9ACTN|nr:Taurine transport ATP-binding protein TauB [Euzebya pacifica]
MEENIMLPARILGLDMAWARDRVPDLLELVRLGGQGTKYPRELSGGMQQRVAIARALLPDPEVLFMDEPFGALDAMTREELNMSLQAVHLAERKTVVFVTHSISEAVLLSDRVIVMSARPGAVIDQVAIPSDRPRDMVNLGEPRFHEAQVRIREGLSGAVDSQRSNP